jgi:hypothetical protein
MPSASLTVTVRRADVSGEVHSLSKDETAPATRLPRNDDAIRLLGALVKNLPRNYSEHLRPARRAIYLDLSLPLNSRYIIGLSVDFHPFSRMVNEWVKDKHGQNCPNSLRHSDAVHTQ